MGMINEEGNRENVGLLLLYAYIRPTHIYDLLLSVPIFKKCTYEHNILFTIFYNHLIVIKFVVHLHSITQVDSSIDELFLFLLLTEYWLNELLLFALSFGKRWEGQGIRNGKYLTIPCHMFTPIIFIIQVMHAPSKLV